MAKWSTVLKKAAVAKNHENASNGDRDQSPRSTKLYNDYAKEADYAMELKAEADSIFLRMSGSDGVLNKDELIEAHHGNFGVFADMDSGVDGLVTRDQWHSWLKTTREEKGEKGDKWLSSLLHTLSTNLREAEEKKAVASPTEDTKADTSPSKVSPSPILI